MKEESSKILSVLSANLFLSQFSNTETIIQYLWGSLILKMFSDILKSMPTKTKGHSMVPALSLTTSNLSYSVLFIEEYRCRDMAKAIGLLGLCCYIHLSWSDNSY